MLISSNGIVTILKVEAIFIRSSGFIFVILLFLSDILIYPIAKAIERGHIFIFPIKLLLGVPPFFSVFAFIPEIIISNSPFVINILLFGMIPEIKNIEKNLSDITSNKAPSSLSAFKVLAIFPSKKSDKATNDVTLIIVFIEAPLFIIIGMVIPPINLEKLSQFGISDFLFSG